MTKDEISSSGGQAAVWLMLAGWLFLMAHFHVFGALQERYYRLVYGNCGEQFCDAGSQLVIDKEPHDCNFIEAPLGAKGCHYEKRVMYNKDSDTVYIWYEKVEQ